ncbi:MAG: ectonucleotide pyrophosphatase/phosphodiesterase [Bacteroidales bacterium]|nr:alkaline phosphatase family protein [Lentimicrobiaceae bacterium]MDD5693935.1 ectonucleotide pyrophosphatase/phosphodiesterase [Bacteroidales bacterium]
MKTYLLFAFSFLIFLVTKGQDNYVILVSMDAFRWDYPDRIPTPSLDYMELNGVRAEALIPCFPTKTFPNHYSIATGLYPDEHGIVDNSFYDPWMDEEYAIRKREAVTNPDFYDGEPIWVTAEKQNVTSACFFWVGSEAPIRGIRPTYWKEYSKQITFGQRIDTLVHWLSLPEDRRPHLITLYFEEPDAISHTYGPVSPQTDSTVQVMDSLVGVLIQKLQQLPHYPLINLIVLSDHGMGSISEEKVIFLSDYLQPGWIENYQGGNPNYNISTTDDCLDIAFQALRRVDHITTWKVNQVPCKLHYGKNPRCGDLVVVADSGWSVRWDNRGSYEYGGAHGYVPENPDMHAIFYAMGPSFKSGFRQPSFSNLDVYSLIARILDIKPAKTSGSLKKIKHMLK